MCVSPEAVISAEQTFWGGLLGTPDLTLTCTDAVPPPPCLRAPFPRVCTETAAVFQFFISYLMVLILKSLIPSEIEHFFRKLVVICIEIEHFFP